jgi:hypothetical protein
MEGWMIMIDDWWEKNEKFEKYRKSTKEQSKCYHYQGCNFIQKIVKLKIWVK